MSQIRLPPAAAEALAKGNFIEAVKIVRETSGLALKQARDLVHAYHEQTLHARGSAGASAAAPTTAPTGSAHAGGFVFPRDAQDAIAHGEFIEAIAALRRANPQLDLKTAKAAIDRARNTGLAGGAPNAPAAPHAGAQRVPTVVEGDRGGGIGLVAAFLLALAALGWWFFGAR